MKILIFRTYPSIMNINNYNSQEIGMAKEFVKAGYTCDIIYYNGSNKSFVEKIEVKDHNPINLYWLKGFSILNSGFFFGLKKVLNKYDCILVSEYEQLTSWFLYTFSKKRVFIYHGQYNSIERNSLGLKRKLFNKLLLRKKVTQNATVFTKSLLAEHDIKNNGFKNVYTVGVGMDFDRFQNNNIPIPKVIVDLKNSKNNFKYLLYIGVIEDRRNIKFLFETFRKVLDHDINTKLIIVGKGKNPYYTECLDYAKSIDISDNLFMIDQIEQQYLKSLYEICDLFLLPSKYEIFGMVLLEAMYCGVPIVTSLNGGSSTLIINDDYGTVIDDFDANLWSEEILCLLNNENKRKIISENSKKRVREEFSWHKIIEKYLKVMSKK